jgi:hypothetical protein
VSEGPELRLAHSTRLRAGIAKQAPIIRFQVLLIQERVSFVVLVSGSEFLIYLRRTSLRHYCEWCSTGRYSTATAQTNASTCIACGAGKYSPTLGAASRASCITCEFGKYSATKAAHSCTRCVPGKYNSHTAQTSSAACIACEAGKYTSASASQSCRLCSSGQYVATTGSTYDLAAASSAMLGGMGHMERHIC